MKKLGDVLSPSFFIFYFLTHKLFLYYTHHTRDFIMIFQFNFKFDGDKQGQKAYSGTITQCVKKFNSDCKRGILPQVETLISINNLSLTK